MGRFLLLIAVCAGISIASAQEPSSVDMTRLNTIRSARQLWGNMSDALFTTAIRQDSPGSATQLIEAIETLFRPIRNTEEPRIDNTLQYLYAWERIQGRSQQIRALFETYVNFLEQQKQSTTPSRRAWLDIAETVLGDTNNADIIDRTIMSGTESDNNQTIAQLAIRERGGSVCEAKQSTQLLLYNMYASTQLTQLKDYAMKQSAWAILQLYEQGDNEAEANENTDMYIGKCKEQADMFIQSMATADNQLWKCDPQEYKEHETYEQLTRVFQGYIENEVDMNPSGSCRGACSNYQFTSNYGCYQNKFCSQQPVCKGSIINCQFIESDMTVCQSYPDSARRYEYIRYRKSTLLGTDRITDSDEKCNQVTVDSWWRFFMPAHCSYCLCICDEQGTSTQTDRYFSLSSAVADVTNDKVVTGVRFVKMNGTIHVQIQQGSLMPHGEIDSSTVEWVPVRTNMSERAEISWHHRSLDLDELQAPEGHGLTGVRFREVGAHLNLEIMVTPVNFNTGNLRRPTELSYWHGNENTDSALERPRSEINLQSSNVPSTETGPTNPDSKHDTFIKFTHSDIITDVAQTTVPFIDIQPVTNDPPSLLSGAGLYHKGSSGSSGFVGLKVFSYDMSSHLTGDIQ